MVEAKTPWVTHWGREDDGWNIIELSDDSPEADADGELSDGSGMPGRWLVGQAVARWSLTQPVAPTAEIVASIFNLPLGLAADAMGVLLHSASGSLSSAVQVWSALQHADARDVTVGEAALAFHLSPAAIVDAAANHYYLFLRGDRSDPASLVIEHEGE